MAKTKKARSLPPAPALVLDPQTTTPAMRSSLESLHSCLLCPLCNQVFVEPSTLPCSHTFCLACMDEYACNAWTCPVPSCGFPLTVRGAREGSYLKINPQIQTVVTSLAVICKTLNEAPKEWWKAEEDEEEDSDEELVNLQGLSPSPSKRSDQSISPEDSEQTEAFARPAASSSPPDWMDPIAEDTSTSDVNRSCALPSQSPNCSPIAHVASQGTQVVTSDMPGETTHDENAKDIALDMEKIESSVVRFEEATTTIPATGSVPSVLVVSTLTTANREMLDELVETEKITLHSLDSNERLEATYAVCGNAEMETGDGFLVGRTYGYLLSVACGIPIVNISFLQGAKKDAFRVDKPEGNTKHQVIGDMDCKEWMAPQRSMDHKLAGTPALLDGYSILLYGEFDPMPKCGAAKRSRGGAAKNAPNTDTAYSADRLERLLRTCGAAVFSSVESFREETKNDQAAIMVHPNPHPRDWRAARKEMEDFPTVNLISGNWILDSISDFHVKDFSDYTQANAKSVGKK